MKDKKDKKKLHKIDKSMKPISNLDFDALDLAIVDDRIVEGKMLVLKRQRSSGDIISLCTIKHVTGTYVMLFDETLEQQFGFDMITDPGVKKLLKVYDKSRTRKNVPVVKEIIDDIPMDEETDIGAGGDDETADSD